MGACPVWKMRFRSQLLSLLNLDARFFHDLAPARYLGVQSYAELIRRAAARIHAEFGQRIAHLLSLQRFIDGRVQPRGHRGRRASFQQEARPILARELWITGLGEGRHFGQYSDAFHSSHRKRAQLAGVDELHDR
jgi:hypothetical protein